jgi:hypothetical protein
MHHWRIWVVLGLSAMSAAGAATVYKWTDAAGVVHFSDQAVPGAEKIVTSSGASNGIGGETAAAPAPAAAPKPLGAPPGKLGYFDVAIDSPSKEQVFFNDDEVPVHLHLTPGLQQNHTVQWQLNGQPLDDYDGVVQFSLAALPRGAYSLAATVRDPQTGDAQSSEAVTFYFRQPSALAPQHKK